METFNMDLLMSEISPRLPAKAIGRFKCVSKLWLHYLSSDVFVKLHCRFISNSSKERMLVIRDNCYYIDSMFDKESDSYPSSVSTLPFTKKRNNVIILASLDGLLCVSLKNTSELFLWNPITNLYKLLSKDDLGHGFYDNHSDAIGMYVDSLNDYKILHIKRRRDILNVFVYSRLNDSWTEIEFLKTVGYSSIDYSWSPGALCEDVIYFTVCQTYFSGKHQIIAFDVNSEKFKEIGYPSILTDGFCHSHFITVEDVPHVFFSYGFPDVEVDLWSIKDGSWTKIKSFHNIRYITLREQGFVRKAIMNNVWLVMTDWGAVFQIDMATTEYRHVYPLRWYHGLRGVLFHETILSPFN